MMMKSTSLKKKIIMNGKFMIGIKNKNTIKSPNFRIGNTIW